MDTLDTFTVVVGSVVAVLVGLLVYIVAIVAPWGTASPLVVALIGFAVVGPSLYRRHR